MVPSSDIEVLLARTTGAVRTVRPPPAFAELRCILLAAEAASAHRSAGYRTRAGVSAARARALAARCDGARTPALDTLDPAVA